MIISSYTSSKEVINNFFRNTGYEEHVNYGDLAYWIYECMELIQYPLQYIPKVMGAYGDESYDLENYRVKLPQDFHKLMAVSVEGVLALPSTNLFHQMLDGSCCGTSLGSLPAETFYDNFGNTYSPQALPISSRTTNETPTFTMNNSYITFSVKEGKVCMAYWAFPLDKEGFPLIPDDVKYKRACSSYIQWKIDTILWRKDLLNNNVYLESKNQYEWDIASCLSHLKMPDTMQMENMKRQLTKMIVRTEDFQTAFNSLNNKGFRGRY
jgi:hypothetical protein